jgi:holo-[acyl-carrier protein] synthase
MIVGIGIDIIEFDQMRRAIERGGQRFLERVFTPHEQATCLRRRDHHPSLCARFAAKEALAKALRLGIFRAGLRNMEVRNYDDGAPYFVIHGSLQDHLAKLGHPQIYLSLSHRQLNAVACVVVESHAPVPGR